MIENSVLLIWTKILCKIGTNWKRNTMKSLIWFIVANAERLWDIQQSIPIMTITLCVETVWLLMRKVIFARPVAERSHMS